MKAENLPRYYQGLGLNQLKNLPAEELIALSEAEGLDDFYAGIIGMAIEERQKEVDAVLAEKSGTQQQAQRETGAMLMNAFGGKET